MVMGETLAYHARNNPDGLALVFEDQRLSWRELDERANRIANGLRGLGAEHGDKVMVFLDNSVEFIECYYGISKIGGISAPLLPSLVPREAVTIAESLEPTFVIAQSDAGEKVHRIRDRLDRTPETIGVGDGHDLAHDYGTLTDEAAATEPGVDVDLEDPFSVKFTSGTTGLPKGCLRTHGNFIMAASIALIEFPYREDDVGILTTPLAAGFAVSMLTMFVYRGMTTVLLPEFDSEAYLDALEREEVTVGTAMTPIARRFMEHPRFETVDLSKMRLLHGLPSPDLLQELREKETFNAEFTSGYASSEAGGLVTFKTPEDYEREIAAGQEQGSVGREGLLYRVAILDDEQNEVAPGEAGEVSIRGPSVFQEYWGRPEKTAEVFGDGWLLTGDVGFKDKDGYVYLLGRKDDRIDSGGMNVYPAEVEAVLESRDAVLEASVVGLPDADWGERVVACVVPAGECSTDELDEFCREELAAHKRPKEYVFMESLPKNEAGKVLKEELNARIE